MIYTPAAPADAQGLANLKAHSPGAPLAVSPTARRAGRDLRTQSHAPHRPHHGVAETMTYLIRGRIEGVAHLAVARWSTSSAGVRDEEYLSAPLK